MAHVPSPDTQQSGSLHAAHHGLFSIRSLAMCSSLSSCIASAQNSVIHSFSSLSDDARRFQTSIVLPQSPMSSRSGCRAMQDACASHMGFTFSHSHSSFESGHFMVLWLLSVSFRFLDHPCRQSLPVVSRFPHGQLASMALPCASVLLPQCSRLLDTHGTARALRARDGRAVGWMSLMISG